jgi:hypothetical protein
VCVFFFSFERRPRIKTMRECRHQSELAPGPYARSTVRGLRSPRAIAVDGSDGSRRTGWVHGTVCLEWTGSFVERDDLRPSRDTAAVSHVSRRCHFRFRFISLLSASSLSVLGSPLHNRS